MTSRILFVDQYAYMGGAQRVLLDLILGLRANDYEVVSALNGRGEFRDLLTDTGIAVEALPLGHYRSGRKRVSDYLRFPYHTMNSARILAKQVRKHHSTLIYANGPRAFIACALAGRKTHRPVIWHLHNVIHDRLELHMLGRFGQMVGHIIACSEAAAAPLIQQYPRLRSKTHVIYNGIPSWVRMPQSPEEKVIRPESPPRKGLVFGISGRITPAKGQTIFLEAASLIFQEFPDTRFLIVGSPAPDDPVDQSYLRALHQQAESSNLGDRVRFAEHQRDPAEIYAWLDVLVVASTVAEAFPLTILEAMALNIPVIAPALGGIREMIRNEYSGLLVKGMTPESLAAAMRTLICNPRLRAAFAHTAHEEATRRFSQKKFLGETLKLFEICQCVVSKVY